MKTDEMQDEFRIMTLEKQLDQEQVAHLQTQANFTTVVDGLLDERNQWRERYQAISKQELAAVADRDRYLHALQAISKLLEVIREVPNKSLPDEDA